MVVINTTQSILSQEVHKVIETLEHMVGVGEDKVETELGVQEHDAERDVKAEVAAVEADVSPIIHSLVYKIENGVSRIDIRLHHALGEAKSIVLNGEHTVEKLITRVRALIHG